MDNINKELSASVAVEINKLHSEICGYARITIGKAIRIGGLLAEQKSKCKHGEWLPWIEANIQFTDRTARNYMRVYERRDLVKMETISDLTGVYKLLGENKDDLPDFKSEEGQRRWRFFLDKLSEMVIEIARLGQWLCLIRDKKIYKKLESEPDTGIPFYTFGEFCKAVCHPKGIYLDAIELYDSLIASLESDDESIWNRAQTELRLKIFNAWCPDEG